jgi:hypothetical protein
MSDTAANTPAKPTPVRGDASAKHALAHVEKWMAVIREISANARDR